MFCFPAVCHKLLNPISHTVMEVTIFWQMVDNCFFWSAVWAFGDSSLRLSYDCNINPLAHEQNIVKVKMKHDLIPTGSLALCQGYSLLPLNYVCIHKWYLARRPTFLQLAVTYWLCAHSIISPHLLLLLDSAIFCSLPPARCTVRLWRKKHVNLCHTYLCLLWFTVIYRTNKCINHILGSLHPNNQGFTVDFLFMTKASLHVCVSYLHISCGVVCLGNGNTFCWVTKDWRR